MKNIFQKMWRGMALLFFFTLLQPVSAENAKVKVACIGNTLPTAMVLMPSFNMLIRGFFSRCWARNMMSVISEGMVRPCC